MGFIGVQPASAPLTASDITDGIVSADKIASSAITTVKLNDDAITLAKMASGTDGQVITYDASGNPSAVGPGTDGQVLTSTGAGSPPAFEDASGGSMILVGSMVSSGSSSGIYVQDCFSATYQHYFITYNMDFSSDGAKCRMRFLSSGTTQDSNTYLQSSARDSGSGSVSGNYNNTSYAILNDDGQSNFNNIPLTGHLYVTEPNSSSIRTSFRNHASTSDAGRNSGFEVSGGHQQENTSHAGISFYPDGGTFSYWSFRVYGIVNS